MRGPLPSCAGAALLLTISSCGGAPAEGAAGAGAPVVLTRDAAIGAKFGSPGPRSCSGTTQPVRGAMTPALARAYVICGYEGVQGSDTLLLQSQVQVQVGAPRPYVHVSDSLEAIDPHKSVYDIRGRSVVYSCATPGGVLPHDKLCSRQETPDNKGKCYQTTFGDWRCTWGDLTAPISTDTRLRIAPPSIAEAD